MKKIRKLLKREVKIQISLMLLLQPLRKNLLALNSKTRWKMKKKKKLMIKIAKINKRLSKVI